MRDYLFKLIHKKTNQLVKVYGVNRSNPDLGNLYESTQFLIYNSGNWSWVAGSKFAPYEGE